jgi:hypothetical protein
MIDTGSLAFGIVGVIVPIGIIGLMVSSASKRWFHAVRGATLGAMSSGTSGTAGTADLAARVTAVTGPPGPRGT